MQLYCSIENILNVQTFKLLCEYYIIVQKLTCFFYDNNCCTILSAYCSQSAGLQCSCGLFEM